MTEAIIAPQSHTTQARSLAKTFSWRVFASIDTFKTARNAPPLALTDEQVKALPVPLKAAAAPETEAPAPARTYPPLEPRP